MESSGGSFFEPLTMSVTPAFFHPFAIDCLPSELDKWLYMLTIQVVWIGLRTESHRSTSTSSRTTPESSWLSICGKYQDVNWSLINVFASLLTVKSSSDEDEFLDFLLDIYSCEIFANYLYWSHLTRCKVELTRE